MRVPTRRYDKVYERADPHISRAKFDELKNKLEKLKNITRFRAMSEVSRLAEMGDFSENAAYQIAKGKLRGINAKIIELEDYFKTVKIIEPNADKSVVELGSVVRIKIDGREKTYEILGSVETDPLSGIISHNSPLGSALLGKKVGAIFKLPLAKKKAEIEILEIK
jgi:transcription elongation factor GreA